MFNASDSEDDEVLWLALNLFIIKKYKNKRRRRFAVRPINRCRQQMGFYDNLLKFMKMHDHDNFFIYTRMTPNLFDNLLRLIEPYLKKNESKNPLTPAHRLLITLHYLSEGCSMREIAWGHYIGHSTVCSVIHETTKVLWNVLMPVFLKPPSTDDFVKTADGFFKRWNMPNCIGAVDGKHIVMQSPKYSGSAFYNYKQNHSIVLMATCDAYYKFTTVDVGAAGSNHDSTVFKASGFGSKLINKTLNIPGPKELPNTNIVLPHFIVGDAAFPLHENIMRPYPGYDLPNESKIFNYRLSRARRCIENTFGILASRWRILRKPIIANVETVEDIVLAVVVLHNYLQKSEEDIPESERKYCPTGFGDGDLANGDVHVGTWRDTPQQLQSVRRLGSNNASAQVRRNRDLLRNYFNVEAGSVPWQLEKIMIGMNRNNNMRNLL